ncbi:MAG: polysaccharide deacetylase family protein [Chryseobacterium sp.]|uniref:polysaccharide deacetylase family protein n=1 Tax=Chryseobacterium sp. TaxID=1871047 RepID=UPI001B09FC9D|nr:polysaccharide deacetylase family protein [Chryseobacterium sp.]MBO6184174.1 polysaccharide deacetylase family protein [Chryseobacterium sp.]
MLKLFFKKANAFSPIQKRFPLDYIIPVYHCVTNSYLPHLRHIINYKSSLEFEKDLDYMSTRFEFVDVQTFIKNHDNKINKPYALLTFDDGYAEFKDVIMPILLRKGIYAINYINPSFIKNDDMMFRLKVSLIIERILNKDFMVRDSLVNSLMLSNPSKKDLIAKVKAISYTNRHLLNQIGTDIDLSFDEYLKNNKIYLNIDDLKYIQDKGFGISAHSWDHPYLTELSISDQIENIQQSIDFMTENGFSSDSMAFPFTDFGLKRSMFNTLFKDNKNLKFTLGTAGLKFDSVDKNLQRVPMENGFSAADEINFESNYFHVKKIFNKNKIIRR